MKLSAERWRRIEPILEEALALDHREQRSFLAQRCGGDASLRADIEQLLALDRRSAIFESGGDLRGLQRYVDAVAGDAIEQNLPAPEKPSLGRIGKYQLQREIGAGGMGHVYLAVRADDEFHQRVAIKIMKRLATGGQESSRFRTERQILATLEHPSIGRILDGGVSEEGSQYLVMEYIEGLPLIDYSRRHSLSLDARLALFERICETVEFAHSHLVVHRDLKPSNILVTSEGRPKLLDFGIAKLLDPDGLELVRPIKTRTGILPMTPEYAAPEQFSGGTVTTATDVYALGVVLFELLTGERPYSLLDRSAAEVEEIVLRQPPPKPSSRADSRTDGFSVAPGALRGDLDTIVVKALGKEPEQRYRSASDLAADLKRFRTGHPIEGRPPTTGYRVRKFIGRHRLAVAAATVVAGLAIVFLALLLGERQRTLEQKQLAQQEARTAREVSDFMVGIFESADPEENLGESITAGELLDRGVDRAAELDAQPLARARFLRAIGRAYASLGNLDKAKRTLREALSIQEVELEGSTETVNETRDDLAGALLVNAEFDTAEELYRASLEAREAKAGPQSMEVVKSLNALGVLLVQKGDHEAALPLLSEAVTIARERLAPDDVGLASHLVAFGDVLHSLARYERAETTKREALAILRAAEDRGPEVANCLFSLGTTVAELGRFEEAAAYNQEAADIRMRIYGERHHLVAQSLNARAGALESGGYYPAAEEAYRETLKSYRNLLGERHLAAAIIGGNLGLLLEKRGLWPEAEAAHREAVAIAEENVGESSTHLTQPLVGLANARRAQGDFVEAELLYRRALEIARENYPARHPRTAWIETELGRLLVEQDRAEEAETLLRAAHAAMRSRYGIEHEATAHTAAWLGAALEKLNRVEEGRTLIAGALEVQKRLLPATHPHIAETENLAVGAGPASYRQPVSREAARGR